MQKYNRKVYKRYLKDLKSSPPHHMYVGCEGVESSFTEPFITGKDGQIDKSYAQRVLDLAAKEGKDYSRIGILDLNDLIQEYNLAMFKSWDNIAWDRVSQSPEEERQYLVWAYLKKSIRLAVKENIKNLKDGIRVPIYQYKKGEVAGFLTRIFPTLFENQFFSEDMPRYEQEILSDFLELTLDKYLDRRYNGSRNTSSIERNVIAMSYGLDGVEKKSAQQLADYFNTTTDSINSTKKRALKKLRDSEAEDWVDESFKDCVATFLVSEEIKTGSAAYEWAEKMITTTIEFDERDIQK